MHVRVLTIEARSNAHEHIYHVQHTPKGARARTRAQAPRRQLPRTKAHAMWSASSIVPMLSQPSATPRASGATCTRARR
eukprot:4587291-Pleurochrysis_carterae.AAC.1